ncbi:MAG: amidohydrolase family protein [archaeon]|nr:amidohydrolase family protein [archaeon]
MISKSKYALVGGTIINGVLNETPKKGNILISDGKIKSILEPNEKISKEYEKFDIDGQYILPGLINAHCHLISDGRPSSLFKISKKVGKRLGVIIGSKLGKRVVQNLMDSSLDAIINSGVTTVRVPGGLFYFDEKYRNEINEGKRIGPRILHGGWALVPPLGHASAYSKVIDTKESIKEAIEEAIENNVDFIKICSTGGVTDSEKVGEAGEPQMSLEMIQNVCEEAHKNELMVCSHCQSTEGIQLALEGGIDSIEHGAVATDEQVKLFKNNPKTLKGYTTFVATLSPAIMLSGYDIKITKLSPIMKENAILIRDRMISGVKKAKESGLTMAMGSDASAPLSVHYNFWSELYYYEKYGGFSKEECLYQATLGNAKFLGIEKETGSIEEGKAADVIVSKKNPLENFENLKDLSIVFLNGRVITEPKIKPVKGVPEILKSI